MVILAKNAGFCFGVKRAVEAAEKNKDNRIVTLGPLIHNRDVVRSLEEKGVRCVDDISDVKPGETVVIRSHGATPGVYDELRCKGIGYIDATCPFVKRIHERVIKAKKEGKAVVIVGEAGHPEVDGILGWAGSNAYVVYTQEDLKTLPDIESCVVVAQTTITHDKWQRILSALENKISAVTPFMSICSATQQRQDEAKKIAQQADVMIVVGGKQSSNTRKLFELCQTYCKNVYHIEHKSELSLEKMRFGDIIGIVAGASTPDTMIREVFDYMIENEKVLPAAEGEQVIPEETAANDMVDAESDTGSTADDTAPTQEATETKAPQAPATEKDEFLEGLEKVVRLKKGQIITGNIVQVTEDDVCVNIGYKSDGIILRNELSLDDINPKDAFHIGDEIEAEVISLNDGEGNVLLSRKRIEKKLNWQSIQENVGTDKLYKCVVKKAVKGGVTTKIEGYSAFIPASHLSLKYVEDLKQFEGKELEVTLIDADKKQERLVASYKGVLLREKKENEKKLWENFTKGQHVTGVVKRLTEFGAFVDIGGVDGLLHISDLAWNRVKQPSDVVSEGQELELVVLNVDAAKKKIALGYKQLMPKPWDLVTEKYAVGDVVSGKVVRIVPFGAFVQLESGIDGLVHISQISAQRLEKVEDALRVGDEVEAKVLEVNADKRKISLSIKALLPVAEKPVEKQETVEREDDFHYEIPPVQESTVSLADFFPKKDE